MVNWCKIEEDAGSDNCSAQFIKIIYNYKHFDYDINVLQQTTCLMVSPITVGNYCSSLIACWLVGLQTL